MSPTEALRRLYSVNIGLRVKQGLRNMRELVRHLGLRTDLPTVHIAGTNGKGSTSWKIDAALRATGRRSGLFLSPHLSSFRERIRVDGLAIAEDQVVEGLDRVFATCQQHSIPATFFEMTTALAFDHFARAGVDVVVLETGLGGRLDATNVVDHPLATVITSIGFDHTGILGTSIASIAWEKAGIIKRGSPLVAGPGSPQRYLSQLASIRGAPFLPVAWPSHDPALHGPWVPPPISWTDLHTPMKPLPIAPEGTVDRDFDSINTTVARAVVDLLGGYRVPVTPDLAPKLFAWDDAAGDPFAMRSGPLTSSSSTSDSTMLGAARPRSVEGAKLPWPPERREAVEAALKQRPPCRMDALALSSTHTANITNKKAVTRPLETHLQALVRESASACAVPEASRPGATQADATAVVVLDSAHNPPALEALWESLRVRVGLIPRSQDRMIGLVLASSNDRVPSDMAASVIRWVHPGAVSVAESDSLRAQQPQVLAAALVLAEMEHDESLAAAANLPTSEDRTASRERIDSGDSAEAKRILECVARAGRSEVLPKPHTRPRVNEMERAAEEAHRIRTAQHRQERSEFAAADGATADTSRIGDELDAASGVGVRYARSNQGESAVQAAVRERLQWLLARTSEPTPLLLVCGSMYMMREAREALLIDEPRDEVVR